MSSICRSRADRVDLFNLPPHFLTINEDKMKRIKFLLPLIAIIFIAAGVFAMKAKQSSVKEVKNAPPATYRWFKISGTYNPTDQVLPSDADYIQTSATPPEDGACDGTEKQCISGFDASQTTPSGSSYVLKPNQAPDPSAPNVLKNVPED